ncbi:hypothetical protein [Acetivibrio clariflavus]|uniref:Uncharacterized protein n=1 Tax=Acetivibrio clariflavus (strain DSM 19732 / NBRC 101661 / EBR45) TaxID=720554 RepID=G8LZ04_ACECE|nr:hypothetical protein [Acetivibrio clariflavus]AEV68948.1 hypothetical protein Clocl_2371 [Acetivibrio clariflavus DSM 19732]HOQ00727.1 hypothetical protein [Acetivibrio clariflavus]
MDINTNGQKSNVDRSEEMENVNKAAEDYLIKATTDRWCLRCGTKLIFDDYDSGYVIRYEINDCLYVTFRGV